MAVAGVDELRIQVFGRGSTAVVWRYIRESTFAGAGETLALEIEAAANSVTLEELEATVKVWSFIWMTGSET